MDDKKKTLLQYMIGMSYGLALMAFILFMNNDPAAGAGTLCTMLINIIVCLVTVFA